MLAVAVICIIQFQSAHILAEDQKEFIKKKAQECCTALAAGDYEKLFDLTYPKIMEMAGGRQVLLKATKDLMEQMKKEGIEFKSMTVDEVTQIEKDGDNTYSIVTTSIEMTHRGGSTSSKGYMLGISNDDGKSWKFIDGAKLNDEMLRKLDIKLPEKMKLPEKKITIIEK
jgi:hypothetical protein